MSAVKASDGRTWTLRQEPNAKLRLYILAALHTGARRSELLRLTWGDVDMRQRTITFRNTKNGDSQTLPLTETLRSTFTELPRSLNPAAPVLPQLAPLVLTRSFARLVQRLGVKNLTFHDLRHDGDLDARDGGRAATDDRRDPRARRPPNDGALRPLESAAPPGRDAPPWTDARRLRRLALFRHRRRNARRGAFVTPRFEMAGSTGFEPATSGLTVQCANQAAPRARIRNQRLRPRESTMTAPLCPELCPGSTGAGPSATRVSAACVRSSAARTSSSETIR
jgi:hypothetical protein